MAKIWKKNAKKLRKEIIMKEMEAADVMDDGKKGKCTIYVYTQNGMCKQVKLTVK